MQPLTIEQINKFTALVSATTENEPMAKHTSFRVGGSARLYVVVTTAPALFQAVESAMEVGIPWFVYGGGSNLLVADEGFEGVVIQVAMRSITVDGANVVAEAGAITAMVARKSVEAGLTGFEWAAGIPGTIGGALFGDAGCYGSDMGASVESVDVYRPGDRKRLTLSKSECKFGYRDSLFKHELHVILACTLKLAPSPDVAASKLKLEEITQKRKGSQPLDQSSAGCIFKNFEFTDPKELEILKRTVEIPEPMLQSGKIAAGWLIDKAGLLGQRIGEVEVSQKHGNFFLNKGTARAQDIVALISLAKMKVRDDLGIELHEEVQLLGF